MIVPDINLLIYAYNELAPHHLRSKRWWEKLLSEDTVVSIPWAVTLGFVRLMTHRQVLETPLPVSECCSIVEEWFSRPNVQPLEPGSRHFSIFKDFLSAAGAGGNLVTNAHIAAMVVEHSCELHSNDSDFLRFAGLKLVNPLLE
ncbi:type II toxin-antitoxin system VapC family toxin [bacterium]|nr:type II toxin-antitoxin system VapC family toxin [bacterium]MCI0603199.1 type II toxin-antitoxin system VapC family toxin [bacterium]